MNFYVYILECSDKSLYTGYTVDIKHRIKMHNQKKASKYTRGRVPVKLKYFETYDNKSDALKREYSIKQLTRDQKLDLINSKDLNLDHFE
ncbi:GIY-YIG nuclease family protein [Peptoniphilus obesi]|uniref:GIY-YIG nuclease family protein n=1 Tax=Peptoniphilus obesi TaxID=1472765 RepID=UPI000565EB43|nr:GIY-YIG nuclease family protein [Peptoniphilus obesi]